MRPSIKGILHSLFLRSNIILYSLLFHKRRQLLEKFFLENFEIPLSETARMNEFIKVLIDEDLNFGHLLLLLAVVITRSFVFWKQIDLILLQELLDEHFFEVALVTLGVEAPHLCLVLLGVEVLPKVQCILGHI